VINENSLSIEGNERTKKMNYMKIPCYWQAKACVENKLKEKESKIKGDDQYQFEKRIGTHRR